MKIKIKNIFNNKDTYEKKQDIKEELKNVSISKERRRRKGAYIKEEKEFKEINLKKYFDNLFKNKNKLSKGYYILLFCMVVLGGASVGLTFKAYNLFAKEEYELYAETDIEDAETVSTISEVENVEKGDITTGSEENKNSETNTNAAEAKVNTTSNTTKTTTTVKALSFSKPLEGETQKPYSIDKVIYSKTLELWKTHDGIDISAEIGTSVKSIEKGTIEKVYDDVFYGTTVVIDH